MKSSVLQSSVQVNDQTIDDVQYLDPFTLYINPYYVVTELQGGDKISKHYYMNTQRVATDISINYQGPLPVAGPVAPGGVDPTKPSADKGSASYNAAFTDLQATLEALGHPKLDVEALGAQPTLEGYYPELVRETAFHTTAAKNAPESTTRVMFWYHHDYLGNVDLVTERDGKTYEFFTYNPWGEEIHQYNANTFSFSSPYRFNSKEKDQETGLHYYGARYYQSKLSVWLSVDPKAHWYPNKTPFNFSGNNPLNIVDPNGMWEQDPDGNWVAQKGDSAGSLARDAGISQSAAESIIRDYNSSNNHNRSSDIMVYVGDVVQFTGKGGSSSSNRKHSAVEHNRPANSRDSQERSEINGKVSKGLNILSYIRAGQELLVDNGYIKATGSAITLYSMYHANRRFNNGEIEKVKRDIAIKDGIPSLFFPQFAIPIMVGSYPGTEYSDEINESITEPGGVLHEMTILSLHLVGVPASKEEAEKKKK